MGFYFNSISFQSRRFCPQNGFKICMLIMVLNVWQAAQAADTTLIDVITLPYNINTIASDSNGTIWLSGARGLQYYDFDQEIFVTTDSSFTFKILAEEGKVIRYLSSKELPTFPWEKFSPWLSQMPPGNRRLTTARDKFGRYWISTSDQLFIFSIENRFDHILSAYSTRGIYLFENDLYIHTYSGILKNGVPVFERPQFGIGEIKQYGEELYFAWGGLIRYEPSTQAQHYLKFETSHSPLLNPRSNVTQSLDKIRDTIWVGTKFGLGYITNDSVVMITNYPDIQDVASFQDGMLVAGSNFLDPHRYKSQRPPSSLPKPDCEDCRGMYLWQNSQLQQLDLPQINYRQILEADGIYYFASDSGVVVWDGERVTRIITENDGLTSNQSCNMVLDEYGFLWVSTFSGLNRINLSTGKITHYLKNIEFNYRSVLQHDSLIYMGSIRGVYIFNPEEFIGDDIEPAPSRKSRDVVIAFGVAFVLAFSLLFYFLNRYYHRRARLKEAQLRETEKNLFLLQVDQIVFTTNISLTVSSLADYMEMSERTLYRSFKEYNITPGAYLKELKLKRAQHLLKQVKGKEDLKAIAKQVGYTESYLKKLLKKQI